MSQVSKRRLSPLVEEKLFSIFFKALARLSNISDVQKFLFDLLGPTERTMLAKRLAIALLLEKGHSYERIKGILKVSQETIARVNIALNYQGEGYGLVVKKILRDQQVEKMLENIEDTLITITPNSSVKRLFERDRKKTRKPKTSLG